MDDVAGREPTRDPQDLERLLVSGHRARDVQGMMVLHELHAVIDSGDGQLPRGMDAIRSYPRVRPPAGPRTSFAGVMAAGRTFAFSQQRLPGFNPGTTISGDLALTSTRPADGAVTAESLPRSAIWKPASNYDAGSLADGSTALGSGSSTNSPTRRRSRPRPARPFWRRHSTVALFPN